MIQAARCATKLLSDSTGLVVQFLWQQFDENGGFKDRSGTPDLYYTVFGLNCLESLQIELPERPLRSYLEPFGDGGKLDFVHRCALARCWAALPNGDRDSTRRRQLLAGIEAFRTPDGGYHSVEGSATGTAYGGFLALGAYLDLGVDPHDCKGLIASFEALAHADGGYVNAIEHPQSALPATAAAVTALHHFSVEPAQGTAAWLSAQTEAEGGFKANPHAPIPDLLSTATALHALHKMGVHEPEAAEKHLDFVDSLWVNRGSFYGHWAEEHLDVEYTFYGLLALGYLVH